MKKIFLPVALLSVLILTCSCASKPIMKNEWQAAPISADGKPDEWKQPLRFFDGDTKLNYTISNDNENLYFCIKASDSQTQSKIMQAGLQVWIDTTGKTEKQVGIEFPLSAIERGTDENLTFEGAGNTDYSVIRKKFSDASTEGFLTGFKAPVGGRTYKKDPSGISFNVNFDANKAMIYEAIIPFKTFYKSSLTANDSLKQFGFSIIVNALPKPKNSKVTQNQTPPAMNGQLGVLGGLPSGPSSSSDPIYKKNVFWIKIKMAVKL